ncbi:MAG: hypothetical protein GTO17_10675 [Candidatus Aminicenantes bacterium]|nr:hypothetical protein [Candidatus Aminicenantes bacterium]
MLFFSSETRNYSRQEALKVLDTLHRIQAAQLREYKGPLRRIVITESELNSYIAYRIEAEKEEIMKELHLKLFEENKIEGKMFIDLTGQDIPKVLQPQMTFYFAGKLQVEEGKVRLNIKKLFLEEQSIPVLVLDLIIYISSKIDGSKATSIHDWYELPYGIKDFKTQPGKAVIYY